MNANANTVYIVIKPIYYLKNNELTCIEKGKVFLGRYVWQVDTGMFPAHLDKYVKQGFVEKVKAKDYFKKN